MNDKYKKNYRSEFRVPVFSGFLWGLWESAFFFFTPDMLLCFWALKSWRKFIVALIAVIVGSIVTTWILYVALRMDAGIYDFLHKIWSYFPGFKSGMAMTAEKYFQESDAKGVLLGSNSGIPYRVYILAAWKNGVPLADLILWAPTARLTRIILAPVATLILREGMHWLWIKKLKKFDEATLKIALQLSVISYWIAVYIWYWGVFLPTKF